MADYNAASVPPPPTTTNAPQRTYSPKGGAGTGSSGSSSVAHKLDKTLKFMNFGLLAWILLGWLSWLIFLAGISAVTKTANDDFDSSDEVQNTFGFSWLCLWAWFFILLALTVATLASLSSKTRHVVSITSRGMLFFLAILISWLGVEAHRIVSLNRSLEGSTLESRVSTLVAGEIMTLIAACLIAITLLLMDQARSHSGSDAANRNSSLTDAAAATVGGNRNAGGGPVSSV